VALRSDEELDEYIYQVAYCVGEFWTDMCRAHVFPGANLDDDLLKADGVRFGKGLQLVNILRDLPKDLRRGRCYIPEAATGTRGLQPANLLDPSAMENFRPCLFHVP
jgi:farnesyl-diphosphate farnesyltransferase